VANRDPLRRTDWAGLLKEEFKEQYWAHLQAFVEEERSSFPVFPPQYGVFRALQLTPCERTKGGDCRPGPVPRRWAG
jgi:uracil DNA glycosylase